ncbi:PEP-CTERM sorting domain-containing protein [Nitrogeniibacter mangrovi]|uniref:PEP-CTERM sorting domain-containing protein n=1 Tax=Nitrogeniibacter mangrovi TaxID=2016596 RepID=UPI001E5CB9E5|nr:PEP-CTERM sorting domain-containing protein [Nitrogeniibacter mangrovi]
MRKFLAPLALLLASGAAQASLVSIDWHSTGDGLLTRDTASGLEWLDLTQTYNQSVAAVQTQLGGGGLFDGFRLGLAAEVHGLMSAAGLPVSTSTGVVSTAAADLNAANLLTALLGETVGANYGSTYYGARGHLTDNGSDRVVGYYTISGSQLFNDYVSGAPIWPGAGVWLVRDSADALPEGINDVPEPASLALLGLGLAGLMASRRRVC